jgi:hypothetical protein
VERNETHCAVDIQEQSPVVLWGSGAMRFAYCALRLAERLQRIGGLRQRIDLVHMNPQGRWRDTIP